jgi:hypothetical protein
MKRKTLTVYAEAVVGSTRRLVFLYACATLPKHLRATNVKTISNRLRVAGQRLQSSQLDC